SDLAGHHGPGRHAVCVRVAGNGAGEDRGCAVMGMFRVFPLVPSASPSLEKRWGQARGAHALRLRSLRSARTVLLLLLFAPALAVAQSHNDKRATAASVDAPL